MDVFGLYYPQPVVSPPQIRHRLSKPSYQRYRKPPYTYTGMIVLAIQLSAKKKLLLSEIHEALGKMFPFFRQSSYTGWKDSVRHNLSHNQCFTMIRKDPSKKNGKGNFWTVDLSLVQPDVFRRQDTPVSREGKWAPDLQDQLGCPPVILPTSPQRQPVTSSQRQPVTSRPAERADDRISRKRKLDDATDTSVSLPLEKRHQPFHIDSLPPVDRREYTPASGNERLLTSCPGDYGCYLSSSAASPPIIPVNSTEIPRSPSFPPEGFPYAIDLFWDCFCTPFDGHLPALESAISSSANTESSTTPELVPSCSKQPMSSCDFSSCAVISGDVRGPYYD